MVKERDRKLSFMKEPDNTRTMARDVSPAMFEKILWWNKIKKYKNPPPPDAKK